MRKNKIIKILSTLLIIVVMLFAQIPFIAVHANASNENKIMVSMGDSYSSGEGVEKFYHQDWSDEDKSTDPDFLAHRSTKSWPGKLKLKGVSETMKEHKDENWFFVASSGAETKDFKGRQSKDYDRNNKKLCKELNPQLQVFEQFEKNEVDYVTMTIGGNDVGFANIITEAVLELDAFLNPTKLTDKLNNAWAKFDGTGRYKSKESVRSKLVKTYEAVREKTGENTHIIVAGYPKLVSFSSTVLDYPKGSYVFPIKKQWFFSPAEAKKINDSVSKFNKKIEEIITKDLKSDDKLYFASVEQEFSGHEAYSIDSYINPVMLNRSQDLKEFSLKDVKNTLASAYSMHPNDKGTKAYARCVQKVIDDIEKNEISSLEEKLISDTWVEVASKGELKFDFLGNGKMKVTPSGKFVEYFSDDEFGEMMYSDESDGCIYLGYENGPEYGLIYDTQSENIVRLTVANSHTTMLYRSSIKPFTVNGLQPKFKSIIGKKAYSKTLGGTIKATDSYEYDYDDTIDDDALVITVDGAPYVGTPISKNLMFFSGNRNSDYQMNYGDSYTDFWMESLGNNTYLLTFFTYQGNEETGMRDWWGINCSNETISFN